MEYIKAKSINTELPKLEFNFSSKTREKALKMYKVAVNFVSHVESLPDQRGNLEKEALEEGVKPEDLANYISDFMTDYHSAKSLIENTESFRKKEYDLKDAITLAGFSTGQVSLD